MIVQTLRLAACLAALALLTSAEMAKAGNAEDQFAVAAGHYSAGRWELARETFADFLKVYPDREQAESAEFYLAESLIQLKRFDDARRHFTAILTRDPDSPFARQALFRNGESAYLSDKLDQAQVDLDLFCQKYTEDPLRAYALPYLGEIALAAGKAATAQARFSEALATFPEGALVDDCRLGLAQALEELDRNAEAERLYRKLAEDDSPLADRALFHLGLFLYEASEPQDALAVWDEFARRFPASPLANKVQLGRGWAMYRLHKYGDAAECLEGLIKDERIGVEAQYWLGMSLRAQEQWKRAGETLLFAAGAAKGHPLQPTIRFHAGDSLLHVDDPSSAVRLFDALLADTPDSEWADDALLGKIQAAHEVKDYADVDNLASRFAAEYPSSALLTDVQLLHALALISLKKYDQAVGPLEAYLASPEPPQAAAALAELTTCFIKLKRIDRAHKIWERLALDFPEDQLLPEMTHTLAEAAYREGNRSLSARLFDRLAATKNPAYAVQGLSGRAWSQLQAGQMDEAAELFAQLLLEYPESPLATEAALTRGQILEQQGQVEAALAMYHRVIQQYDTSKEMPEALLRAAVIHDNQEQNQQAVVLYTRLIKEFPRFDRLDAALYGLAWAHAELDATDESMPYFRRLHTEFPESKYWADATYRVAESLSEQGEVERAASLLTQLVDADPEEEILGHALYLQGRLAARRELWEAVDAPMSRLIQSMPDSPLRLPAAFSIAEAAYRLQDYRRAGELLAELSPQVAGRKDAWLAMIPLRRAQIATHFEKWEEALELANELQKDFPEFQRMYEVDYLRGRAFAARAQFEDARQAYRNVIQSGEGSKTETAAMAQWMIGETYFHQEDYERARREYLRTEILYDYPAWQAISLLQAGKCLEQLGRWAEAGELYTRAMQKYPGTQHEQDIERRLRVVRQRVAGSSS